jgi:hypothetical protein
MMTQDSFDILVDARSGIYTDAHPPFNAWLWHQFDRFIPGGVTLLVLQLLMLQLGLYLLMRRAASPRKAAWFAVAVALWPPIAAPMGVIWKDCMMAGFLVLGTALLFAERRRFRIIGLLLLAAATAARYNAAAATLPLVVLLFQWSPDLTRVRRYALSVGAWIAITFAAFSFNRLLVDRHMYFWHSTLAVYDIAGTLANVDENIPDVEMEKLLEGTGILEHKDIQQRMRELYSPRDYIDLILTTSTSPMWNMPLYGPEPVSAPVRAAVERSWNETIRTYPLAYAKHRMLVMQELLCLGKEFTPPLAVPIRAQIDSKIAHNLELDRGWSRVQYRMTHALQAILHTLPVFAPWIYLLLSLACLWIARRHPDVLALLISGILMEGTLVVFAMSSDYRYSHWMIITTTISLVILAIRRARGQERVAPTTQQTSASHASAQ